MASAPRLGGREGGLARVGQGWRFLGLGACRGREATWLPQLALPEATLGHVLWALDFGMNGLSGKSKATGKVSVLLCNRKSQKGEI